MNSPHGQSAAREVGSRNLEQFFSPSVYNIDAISAWTYRILTFWMTGSNNIVLDQEVCIDNWSRRGGESESKFLLLSYR